ncbi:MAG TPA: SAM-dependent methyltransferase [Pseudonocardiaceae bacterium]
MNGPDQPSTARIRDYWLGGSHNTNADRDLAEQILVCAPHLPYSIRTQRAFLRRVVRYLVMSGIRQFVDLGSGTPTVGNVHEIAQALDPACRVVYVDIDPVVVAEGRHLLASNDHVVYLRADLRRPDEILAAAEVRALLSLGEPVAVLIVDVLHFVRDSDDPGGLISGYLDALSPGSCLGVSDMGNDDGMLAAMTMFSRMFDSPLPTLTFRDRDRIAEFFGGLDIVDPGVVPVPLWRPDGDDPETDRNPEQFQGYAAVVRKPYHPATSVTGR